MPNFEPELGAIFSHGGFEELPAPEYIMNGIAVIASSISGNEYDYVTNHGSHPEFINDVFSIRAYCWCDGETAGHEDQCPANFEFGDLQVRWYKHLNRSPSINKKIDTNTWRKIMISCLKSLEDTDGS